MINLSVTKNLLRALMLLALLLLFNVNDIQSLNVNEKLLSETKFPPGPILTFQSSSRINNVSKSPTDTVFEYSKKRSLKGTNLTVSSATPESAPYWIHSDFSKDSLKSTRSFLHSIKFSSSKIYQEVKLIGGQLSYMGQVQIKLGFSKWGSICGEEWDVRDATVICRQLGFGLGEVVARPRTEFGSAFGPVVMSKVRCRGDEETIADCPSVEWDGRHSLPCSRSFRAAGVVCGCSSDIGSDVISRCFLFTKSLLKRNYCHYSCKGPHNFMVGHKYRYCEEGQRWSGPAPQCMVGNTPCSSNPCQNKAKCEDYLEKELDYVCLCRDSFYGKNCEVKQTFLCRVIDITSMGHYRCSLFDFEISDGPITDKSLTIITGQYMRNGNDATSTTYHAIYAKAHKNFTSDGTVKRDIAVIKLGRPAAMDKFTSTICLPASIKENPDPGRKCWIAGWGETTRFVGSAANSLQQADIPILSTAKCRAISWRDSAKNYRDVEDSVICAGYPQGGVDACLGDSGGPLMCPRVDGSWYIAGIVSWGYRCADPHTPGVYTRVSQFLNWIDRTTQSLNL